MKTVAGIIFLGALLGVFAPAEASRHILPGGMRPFINPGEVYYCLIHTPVVSTWIRFTDPLRVWLGRTSAEWAEWWCSWTNEEWAAWSVNTWTQGMLYSYEEWLVHYQGFTVQDWADWVQTTGHQVPP